MKPYIYGKRNLIHIINLRETVRGLVIAQKFLTNLAQTNKDILFVGTKWQARDIVIREAQRSGMHYVSERWLGGTLTNFDTIRKRLERLDELESMEQTGAINQFSKKAISSLNRENSVNGYIMLDKLLWVWWGSFSIKCCSGSIIRVYETLPLVFVE